MLLFVSGSACLYTFYYLHKNNRHNLFVAKNAELRDDLVQRRHFCLVYSSVSANAVCTVPKEKSVHISRVPDTPIKQSLIQQVEGVLTLDGLFPRQMCLLPRRVFYLHRLTNSLVVFLMWILKLCTAQQKCSEQSSALVCQWAALMTLKTSDMWFKVVTHRDFPKEKQGFALTLLFILLYSILTFMLNL